MEEMSTKLTRALIIFIIAVFIIKTADNAGFFEPTSYKGKGFYVKIPEGWKKVKEQKGVLYPQGVEVVMFVPKEIDSRIKEPDSYISIFTKKLASAIWIEDEFPEILSSIRKAGYQVMDKGEIKLNDVISEWVVYHDKKTPALVLEFYLVTENNMFYKMQYSAHPDKFNKFRESFEKLRESFKFRFSIF